MKIIIENKNYNIKDNTMVKLNLRGINVGTYKQGDFDKWELNYIEKNNDIIPDIENYICGILHRKYNVPVITKLDVIEVERLLKTDTGLSIIDWFNNELKGLTL
jgi:hypothetical protein